MLWHERNGWNAWLREGTRLRNQAAWAVRSAPRGGTKQVHSDGRPTKAHPAEPEHSARQRTLSQSITRAKR
jgi:hypothetical protein